MKETAFNILGFEVHISTNCEKLGGRLRDITVKAKQDFPHAGNLSCRTIRRDGVYYVEHDGEILLDPDGNEFFSSPDIDRIIIYLRELIHHHITSRLPGILKIHAGCAAFGDIRFMLVGAKGAGKTTLLCKLLFRGATVFCDEFVLLKSSRATPFPRRFHLKAGILELVPELADVWQNLVMCRPPGVEHFHFFDPTDAGFDWSISEGGLDAIFFLEPVHSGPSSLSEVPKWEMAKRVMLQVHNFPRNPSAGIRELLGTINTTDCYNLRLGDLGRAVKIIRDKLTH